MESALSDTPQHLRQLHQQNSDVQQKGLGASPHYRNIAESFFNREWRSKVYTMFCLIPEPNSAKPAMPGVMDLEGHTHF